MADDRREEFRDGLAETRRFLLSHHERAEHYRCYRVPIGGRHLRICARCTGIYPGILVGLLLFHFGARGLAAIYAVALLPLPALVDWAYTTFSSARGWNPARTMTGAALGVAYGLGLGLVLVARDVRPLAIGAVIGGLAGVLLGVARRGHR